MQKPARSDVLRFPPGEAAQPAVAPRTWLASLSPHAVPSQVCEALARLTQHQHFHHYRPLESCSPHSLSASSAVDHLRNCITEQGPGDLQSAHCEADIQLQHGDLQHPIGSLRTPASCRGRRHLVGLAVFCCPWPLSNGSFFDLKVDYCARCEPTCALPERV